MRLFPAIALADEVAANHYANAPKHDEIRLGVVRPGLKRQHGPDEGIHCTHTE